MKDYPPEVYELLAWAETNDPGERIYGLSRIVPENLRDWYEYCRTEFLINPWANRLSSQGKVALAVSRASTTKRRTGRPKKAKKEMSVDDLVVSALALHHQYEQGGSVGNFEPASGPDLEKLVEGLNKTAVKRFFDKKFPKRGYRGYRAACCSKEIGQLLARWQGDENPNYFQTSYDEQQDD